MAAAQTTRKTRATKAPVAYDERNIKRLKFPDNVRHNPGMYLGERGPFMVFQGAKEVIDNCYDEFGAGRNKSIFVYADNKTNTYIVADKAQGIPVGLVPVDPKNPRGAKVSTLTLIFTELHTGGKFDDKAYKTSKGTHGVGAAATNAVSESFEVWTNRDKKWHYQAFSKGMPKGVLKQVTSVPRDVTQHMPYKPTCGTIIRFVPDQSVVSHGKEVAKLNLAFTAKWLRSMALLNPGLEVTFSANGKTKTYLNKDGIAALLKVRLDELEAEPIGKPFVLETDKLTIAIQWSSHSEDDGLNTYVSSGQTDQGGEHEVGLRNSLTKVLNTFKLKNEKFAPTDLYNGLVGFLDWRMSGAEYSGQTKNKLTSHVAPEVEEILLPKLKDFFAKNKALARKIIRRAIDVKKSKEIFKKTLRDIAETKKRAKSSLPPGLVSSPKCPVAARELYLVEGDSAMGTGKNARDSKFQELMGLDGKIMNVAKQKLPKILSSVKIQNILSAIGYNFDIHLKGEGEEHKAKGDAYSKLRVGTIYLLPDADEDGHHIRVLLLTLLWKMMPRLFEEGKVFIVDAPLYSAFYKNKRYFGDTFKNVQSKMPKGAPIKLISRAKGWGEISPEMLAHVAFHPDTRTVVQVLPIKGKELQYFDHLVSSDTVARKELLGL